MLCCLYRGSGSGMHGLQIVERPTRLALDVLEAEVGCYSITTIRGSDLVIEVRDAAQCSTALRT
jgi:hypothetical protein